MSLNPAKMTTLKDKHDALVSVESKPVKKVPAKKKT